MACQSYTLTYSEDSKGWPSFYSYLPDYMIGMNSFFYSFNEGNLYRHNTNENRNEYYNVDGKLNPSTITSVFNPRPTLDIKLFKTLSYESNTTVADNNEARWACTTLLTDLNDGSPGSMLETYFELKEGEWFSFIRTNDGTINWQQRSANGLGVCTNVSGAAANTVIQFPTPIGSIVNIGDSLFTSTLTAGVATTPVLSGLIIAKTTNSVTVNVTGVAPVIGNYIVFIKNAVAESHGARGYNLEFKLENDSTSPVELFSVGSSVMKSYP